MTSIDLGVVYPDLASDMLVFLEAIRNGSGPINAGLSIGWTPEKTRKIMRDPDMVAAVADIREALTETLEERVIQLADRGNARMLELWLFCHAADRGWRPPTQRVQIGGGTTVRVEVVEAARQSALAIMEKHGVKALQPGGALDAGDDDIVDADVVE